MTDSGYVVLARNKQTKELEPVHPGHTSHADALRLKQQLVKQGIPCELWKADDWERHMMVEQADLFCDACGHMKEDCGCRCTKCGERLHGVEYQDDGKPYCEQHWRELPGNPFREDDETPAAPAAGLNWDQLDRLVRGQATAGDIRAEIDADNAQLPDLADPATQDRVLNLLVTLQGQSFDGPVYDAAGVQSELELDRLLAAIHNKLHDEWAQRLHWDADKGHFVPDDQPV